MKPFEVATAFFHACEGLKGWAGCQSFVAEGAEFVAQCEPLVEIHSIEGYCEWMAGLGAGPLAGCGYELHSSAYDEANQTALFFATFKGKHVGEGGPVAATQQETASHYVYVLRMDSNDKVRHITKIWNAPWAMRELGWA